MVPLIKNFLKKYFSFNARERRGFIALSLMVFLLLASYLYLRNRTNDIQVQFIPLNNIQQTISDTSFSAEKTSAAKTKAEMPAHAATLFAFDPNKITEEQCLNLGMSKKLATTLIHFRSKGGKFKKAEDLKKIYGLKEELYKQLLPYMLFEPEAKKDSSGVLAGKKNLQGYKPFVAELNAADSLQLVKVNGIGPVLAQRILKYRNALGGFVRQEQLKEVFGIRDSSYLLIKEFVRIDESNIKKIHINTATLDELKKHPYIKFMVAQSLVNYRNKHGRFAKLSDLLNVGSISEEGVKKLEGYLEF